MASVRIEKRGGTIERFDPRKIKRALLMAFNAVRPGDIPNVSPLVTSVMEHLRERINEATASVSQMQDIIEEVLMKAGHHAVARAFIQYRHDRDLARARRLSPDKWALPNYIHAGKYARFAPLKKRREVYPETVDRVKGMHLNRFKDLGPSVLDRISSAFGHVYNKDVLPSMRSMQFGGLAMEKNNARGYNCSFTLIDRWRAFQEVFYLLLCGCGVGYSVQWQHVDKLSSIPIINEKKVRHHIVEDTIEGWADALGALIQGFLDGVWVEFSYHLIRQEGEPLKTSGGKAPGHIPLRRCLERCRQILLKAQGRSLRPIECSDILCHSAEAVLSGGIRRASLLGLFSAHDTEMLYSKARGNYDPMAGLNSHRAMVNISAALLRNSHRSVFDRIINVAQTNFGDPGFAFLENLDWGPNPCGEIIMNPVLEVHCSACKGTGIEGDRAPGFTCSSCSGKGYYTKTGFSFCNLTEINMATVKTPEEFYSRCEAASLIGTLQASYTSFPYLGSITEEVARRDALLGVSMTGIQDCRSIALDPEVLQQGAKVVVDTNKEWATILGINEAARTTTVKPSGTASLELGCVGPGIHSHWARRLFRRVTANPNEPVAQEFRRINPHMVEVKPDGDWSLIFPIEVPESSLTVRETNALSFIDDVLTVYNNWVCPGSLRPEGMTHNVSCSVTIREGELQSVCDKIWSNRHSVAAMSFIPDTLDIRFPFAPNQAVTTLEDEAKWERLIANYRPVDWTQFFEEEDTTELKASAACSGGVCEI